MSPDQTQKHGLRFFHFDKCQNVVNAFRGEKPSDFRHNIHFCDSFDFEVQLEMIKAVE